jgi:UDP-glucose 4-epimerase
MKILVTGGAGFIGSHIVEALHQEHEVTVLDSLRSGFKRNIEPFKVNFVHGDICDLDLVLRITQGVEEIFHLAALISVPESMSKPEETVRLNVLGTLNLLQAARQNGVRSIVLSSSAAIYGEDPEMPKREQMLPQPKSPYAITKLDGEYYFRMFRNEYKFNAVCLRYFNVFGPRQDPQSQYAAAIPIFVQNALLNRDIVIYGDGEQTRDFIYVKDIAAANILVSEKGGDVYNVAGGKKISINDLCKKVLEVTGSKSKVIYAPVRAGDIKHSLADNSRLRGIGWEPRTDLAKGLEATVRYFMEIFKK